MWPQMMTLAIFTVHEDETINLDFKTLLLFSTFIMRCWLALLEVDRD